MNLLVGINKRYDIMIASKTEQAFYLNVYQYYDYIFSNPVLKNIYQEGAHQYRLKGTDIWKGYDKDNLEKCSHQTQLASKMEKADMYCNACSLEVRLYVPLKDYYETDEPDMLQDPYMVGIVKGIDYAAKVCVGRGYQTKKEITRGFNNWFKNERDTYEQELAIFHTQFISRIEKLEEMSVPEKEPLKPFLNINTGDFMYFGKEGNFPTSGQNFKVLKTLLTSPDYVASFDELVNSYSPVTKATKVHKAELHTIIRNIKRNLGVLPVSELSKPDPFRSIRGEGYRLELQR